LYLSYYGIPVGACSTARTGLLRKRYGLADHMKIVGNANFIYPPKWYLGQFVGLKAHEDVIDALGLVIERRPDVVGVLIGGAPGSDWYERRLRERARAVGAGRIIMTGYLPVEEIRQMWPDFDVAVHVPISENCGGVGEPMSAGVPTIAGRVGGLPEIIIDGLTGTIVPIRQPEELAHAILRVVNSPGHYLELAKNAQALARRMAADECLGKEVESIYSHVLGLESKPPSPFDPIRFLSSEITEGA
jgi:glycosyltransferase involved in cell wall biosynthesis